MKKHKAGLVSEGGRDGNYCITIYTLNELLAISKFYSVDVILLSGRPRENNRIWWRGPNFRFDALD